jgi:hypothetical protein
MSPTSWGAFVVASSLAKSSPFHRADSLDALPAVATPDIVRDRARITDDSS